MVLRIILFLWMTGCIVAALIVAPQAMKLGELARIIYFHVPCAWVSVLAFLWSMVQSIMYLRKRNPYNDISAEAAARIGLVFCIMTTVTGMFFAKATWGAYWNWDPRETSIFVLLLIYLAYFALRMAIDDEERRGRLAAVYSILAFFTVPFLVFVLPRLYFSLHPSPIISKGSEGHMDNQMRMVLAASAIAFTALYVWMQKLAVRIGILANRKENADG